MIFPNLKNKSFGYVNLNTEAKEWYKLKNLNPEDKNILTNPSISKSFIEDIHHKYSIDYSYGGWMEDRSFFLRDWYLDEAKTYMHLGVDFNVPEKTEVATDFRAEVVKIDNDYPLDGGWGPHVILKHLSKPVYVLYAHLDDNIYCKVGDILEEGTIFARVGFAPKNGNWFPHTHIQIIESNYYMEIDKNNDWEKFDGYGLESEIELNKKRHEDPMNYISLD